MISLNSCKLKIIILLDWLGYKISLFCWMFVLISWGFLYFWVVRYCEILGLNNE